MALELKSNPNHTEKQMSNFRWKAISASYYEIKLGHDKVGYARNFGPEWRASVTVKGISASGAGLTVNLAVKNALHAFVNRQAQKLGYANRSAQLEAHNDAVRKEAAELNEILELSGAARFVRVELKSTKTI